MPLLPPPPPNRRTPSPNEFVSQVHQDRSDNDSMRATLELVYQDPSFDQLAQPTIDAVESYFKDQEPLKLNLPEGWRGNTPNGPWEGD